MVRVANSCLDFKGGKAVWIIKRKDPNKGDEFYTEYCSNDNKNGANNWEEFCIELRNEEVYKLKGESCSNYDV